MREVNHVIKRAIIMAAGIGKRMQPLTFETPKPLVWVNGVRMIDTAVDALHRNGITEIYVVVGYLKEQFYAWAADQPGVEIIENPYYAACNNISSLYVAREHLGDCFILDGDQMIYNADVLDPVFTRSGYNATWCEGETDEWLMDARDGIVQSCSRTGGTRGWQLYSISRWTAEDGARLRKQVAQEFEDGNRQIYWDDVAMFLHFSDYELGVWKMNRGDVVEIDDLEDLIRLDGSYESFREGGAE